MPASVPAPKSPTHSPDAKTDAKPVALTIRPPMTAREAQLSSVFDSCIPGNMLMYPVVTPPASQPRS